MLEIETERLRIREFTLDMAETVHLNSLDEDNRRFVPDEVFETVQEARETISFLMGRYGSGEGPFVYPVILRENQANIGYVQLAPVESGWEIGYHIAKPYTGHGYASEAVRAFLPIVMNALNLQTVEGICLADNRASRKVMEKCGFTKVFEGAGPYQGKERRICRYRFEAAR